MLEVGITFVVGALIIIIIWWPTKSVPHVNRSPELSLKEWLEEQTGFKVTKIHHGGFKAWRYIYIEYTFLYNGYITKSASVKSAALADRQHELKYKAVLDMKATAAKNKSPKWDY